MEETITTTAAESPEIENMEQTVPRTDDIRESLARIERIMTIGSKEVLDTEDLAIYIKRSEARIRTLVSKREIPHYKNDRGHVHFRKTEIDQWLLGQKVHTNDELEAKGKQYWSNKRMASL